MNVNQWKERHINLPKLFKQPTFKHSTSLVIIEGYKMISYSDFSTKSGRENK